MATPDAAPAPTPELKTYNGSCLCAAYTFTVKLPEITSVFECDCSICVRKGYKWAFPGEGCFAVVRDGGKLETYEFAGKGMAHNFCSECGTGVSGKRLGAPVGMDMGVNLRTLIDIDILSIPIGVTFNGLAIPPLYKPCSPPTGLTLTATSEQKIYTGSCHCQAVTISFVSGTPIDDLVATECTCKNCVPIAPLILTIPTKQVQIRTTDAIKLTTHISQREVKSFCPTCGVCINVYNTFDTKPEFKLNMRCFTESVDLAKLKVERTKIE